MLRRISTLIMPSDTANGAPDTASSFAGRTNALTEHDDSHGKSSTQRQHDSTVAPVIKDEEGEPEQKPSVVELDKLREEIADLRKENETLKTTLRTDRETHEVIYRQLQYDLHAERAERHQLAEECRASNAKSRESDVKAHAAEMNRREVLAELEAFKTTSKQFNAVSYLEKVSTGPVDPFPGPAELACTLILGDLFDACHRRERMHIDAQNIVSFTGSDIHWAADDSIGFGLLALPSHTLSGARIDAPWRKFSVELKKGDRRDVYVNPSYDCHGRYYGTYEVVRLGLSPTSDLQAIWPEIVGHVVARTMPDTRAPLGEQKIQARQLYDSGLLQVQTVVLKRVAFKEDLMQEPLLQKTLRSLLTSILPPKKSRRTKGNAQLSGNVKPVDSGSRTLDKRAEKRRAAIDAVEGPPSKKLKARET